MNINVIESVYINEKGKRANNEDSVYPVQDIMHPVPGLYMVCDGVGGAMCGEVASGIACNKFAEYFSEVRGREVDEHFFQLAVDYVQEALTAYVAAHRESRDMATTVTLVYFSDSCATLVHLGDSRIYHIRNGRILFRTRDHSVVQELIDIGAISEQAAAIHRDRHKISKAMHANSKLKIEPTVTSITDIAANDYFFLCSDGVLESFTDKELEVLFSAPMSIEEKKKDILVKCNSYSRDNFSAYLIKVGVKDVELEKT